MMSQNKVQLSEITGQTKLGDIVAENYQAAKVLEKYGIDFCCHGNRSLQEACQQQQLQAAQILQEIKSCNPAGTEAGDMPSGIKNWPLDLMADYIEKKHHRYVTDQIPVIEASLQKIIQVHGGGHPELSEIEQVFKATAGELAMHMQKEELMLFPFIRKMTLAQRGGRKIEAPLFGSIQNPIGAMEADHEREGGRSARLRQLTNGFEAPADGCNTYRLTYRLLEDFERDLHRHIHIENNILFPGAISLEEEILA